MLPVPPLPTAHFPNLPAAVTGHPLASALSWAIAAFVAVVLVLLVFKVARRILHRLLGVVVSVAVSSLLHSHVAPTLSTWLHR